MTPDELKALCERARRLSGYDVGFGDQIARAIEALAAENVTLTVSRYKATADKLVAEYELDRRRTLAATLAAALGQFKCPHCNGRGWYGAGNMPQGGAHQCGNCQGSGHDLRVRAALAAAREQGVIK